MLGRVLFYVVGAFFVSLILSSIITSLARRWRILDHPDKRKIHATAVPRGGGIAFILTWLIMAYSAIFLTGLLREALRPALAIALGATVISTIGIWDDIKDLPPRSKLLAQFLATLFLLGLLDFPKVLSLPLLLLVFPWIIGLSNAFNLIDGLDGLATGLAVIASVFFTLLGLMQAQPLLVAFAAILATSCLGFLPFNWHPAKIFMGDAGSMFLGFTLGALALLSLSGLSDAVEIFTPVLFVGVPIFDTLLSIIRRAIHKKPLFKPDKAHFYNLLMNRGFSHRRSVLFSYGLAFLLGVLGFSLKLIPSIWGWVTVAFAAFTLVFLVQRFRLWEEQ